MQNANNEKKEKEGVRVSTQVQSSEALDKKNLLLWLLVFGLPAVFLFLPLNLDPVLQKFFAITMWGVLSWMVGIIPVEATGLILPCLYIIFGVTSGEVAFAPWANTVIWVTATNVLLGVAADKSGVARRMAYSLLLKMDCNIKGLGLGLFHCWSALIFDHYRFLCPGQSFLSPLR